MAFEDKKKHAGRIARKLTKGYPEVECELDYDSPYQLFAACVLSAQCTDERVNKVTPELFKRFPTPRKMAKADRAEIERLIYTTGFYRNKAKSLHEGAKMLVEKYGGDLPRTIGEFVKLPGAGRKTANVVLGTAFGKPTGVVVDTHVKRLTNRWGLTKHSDPVKIERDLMVLLPEKEWIDFSHRTIRHGRRLCFARKPDCLNCFLSKLCPSYEKYVRTGFAKA